MDPKPRVHADFCKKRADGVHPLPRRTTDHKIQIINLHKIGFFV
jgi:hypothetical protein